MPDPTRLCSLDEAKAQLDMRSNAHDAELDRYIAAVTRPIEEVVGAVLPRTVTRYVEANGRTLVLPSERVVSVTSIDREGTTGSSLTGYVVQDNGLVRSAYGSTFCGTYTVTYVEGFAAVPESIRLAACMVVADMWSTQRGNAQGAPITAGSPDDFAPDAYSVPISPHAALLLEPYRRTPSVA